MTYASHPEHIREMADLGDPIAQNAMKAKSVVLVSTEAIEAQIARLHQAIPELRRLRHSLAPNDPRVEIVREALRSATIAEAWLSEAIR